MPHYTIKEEDFNKNRMRTSLLAYTKENFGTQIVTRDIMLAYLAETFPSVQQMLRNNGKNPDKFIQHQRDIAATDARHYIEYLDRGGDSVTMPYPLLNHATDERQLLGTHFPDKIDIFFFPPAFEDEINRIFQNIEARGYKTEPTGLFVSVVDLTQSGMLSDSVSKEKPAVVEPEKPAEEEKKVPHKRASRNATRASLKRKPPAPRGNSHGEAEQNKNEDPETQL